MSPLFSAVDWNAITAVGGLIVALSMVGGAGATRAARWRKRRRDEDHAVDLIRIALFGRPQEGPLPPILGLITTHHDLNARVDAQEAALKAMHDDLETVMRRTKQLEPNGGTSLVDSVRKISEHLGLNDER